MKPIARRERIASIVKEMSRVSVEELAQLLSTSHETVRRDLAVLSERGIVRKVHGGAVNTQTALESPYGDRSATARAEKAAIASRAAQLFGNGDSLLIDAGSTTAADRKSTRLNSSHVEISYAVFCLKKKTTA